MDQRITQLGLDIVIWPGCSGPSLTDLTDSYGEGPAHLPEVLVFVNQRGPIKYCRIGKVKTITRSIKTCSKRPKHYWLYMCKFIGQIKISTSWYVCI